MEELGGWVLMKLGHRFGLVVDLHVWKLLTICGKKTLKTCTLDRPCKFYYSLSLNWLDSFN